LVLLDAAEEARDGAVVASTHAEQARYRRRWHQFCAQVGLGNDHLLDGFDAPTCVRLLGAFAHAVRLGRFSNSPTPNPLMADSTRKHVNAVGTSFLESGRPDPRLDASGNTALLLRRQYRGYSNKDKPTNGQKALPPKVIIRMWEQAETPSEVLLSVLAIAAFFFAMRSCEYLLVEGERRTHIIRKADIRFFVDSVEVPHDSPRLEETDAVTVTFRWQKNDYRQATITMYRTDHAILCPVRAWAKIIQHLLTIPMVSNDTPVCALAKDGTRPSQFRLVSGSAMVLFIRRIVRDIGPKKLGFSDDEVGTHSLRSGSAMAMHLAGVAVYTIMLIGRWQSDAFMAYLRLQVLQFTHSVSKRMVQVNDFYHVPTSRTAAGTAQFSPGRPHLQAHHMAGGPDRVLPSNPFRLEVY
jgi:hypothetical protein